MNDQLRTEFNEWARSGKTFGRFIGIMGLSIMLVFAFASASTKANTFSQSKDALWVSFSVKSEEFTVRMPREPELYADTITDRSMSIPERVYSAYSKGVVYLVVSYDRSSLKGTLENFKLHHCSLAHISFLKDKDLSGYAGKEYTLKFGDAVGILDIYSTKRHGYAVAVVQAKDDPALREFFLSTFSLAPADLPANINVLPTPPSSELSNLSQAGVKEAVTNGLQVSWKPVVVSKPEPSYTDEGRNAGVNGTVVLRVILNSSGEVTNIHVVTGLPLGLTEQAIEAAHHLTFIPAVKDDRFLPYWIELQYNFHLY